MATTIKVYGLKVRADEGQEWQKPEFYRRKRDRNQNERMARCLFGWRTHSFEEQQELPLSEDVK